MRFINETQPEDAEKEIFKFRLVSENPVETVLLDELHLLVCGKNSDHLLNFDQGYFYDNASKAELGGTLKLKADKPEFSKPLAAEYLKVITDEKWGIGEVRR